MTRYAVRMAGPFNRLLMVCAPLAFALLLVRGLLSVGESASEKPVAAVDSIDTAGPLAGARNPAPEEGPVTIPAQTLLGEPTAARPPLLEPPGAIDEPDTSADPRNVLVADDVFGARVVMVSTLGEGYLVTENGQRLTPGQSLGDDYVLVGISADEILIRRTGRAIALALPDSRATSGPLRGRKNEAASALDASSALPGHRQTAVGFRHPLSLKPLHRATTVPGSAGTHP